MADQSQDDYGYMQVASKTFLQNYYQKTDVSLEGTVYPRSSSSYVAQAKLSATR